MASIARTCLQSLLKTVNSVMGMLGLAMILYGFWMARVWQRDMENSSFDGFASTAPWFIYTFMCIGVTLCLVTCLGHVSADSSNGFCLSCYMVIIFVILLLEVTVGADILLNSNWEKDLPEDPTGRFHDFKEFVESNFDIFKWIGLLIALAQGSSILLAMTLKTLRANSTIYDSDDEYHPARVPLINPHLYLPSYVVGDPFFASNNDAWKTNK